ncbi:hypothetical protein SAMN05444162_1336 [Paenibacillaceae bacterium GAS479]|nr:hypothetical protein SAMN05444162_1336 [Paenibacillaceae bacterium GAS479]
MGSFNINIDRTGKVFHAKVEGTFSPEDGMESVKAYQESIAQITVPEYEIHIDCTELNVSSPSALPILEACFQMYKQDGFNKVVLTLAKNPILKMQLGRVARTVGLESCEINEV